MATIENAAKAALATLAILQLIMLGALFADIPPHPPVATPLFGIGPFLGLSLSLVAAAAIIGPSGSTTGRLLSALAAFAALVSFGPQKYFDAQFGLIWPAVICAQIAILTLFGAVAVSVRSR